MSTSMSIRCHMTNFQTTGTRQRIQGRRSVFISGGGGAEVVKTHFQQKVCVCWCVCVCVWGGGGCIDLHTPLASTNHTFLHDH